MRPVVIAANWKMHTRVAEARNLAVAIRQGLDERVPLVEVVLCPPFISLATVKEAVAGSAIKVGAQNTHFLDEGAYTGEISPRMLADLCRYVIIGHSERRQYFGESDESINQKVKALFSAGLQPILCVGETLEENEAKRTEAVVQRQVERALRGVSSLKGLVIAYEPIWAIGTGHATVGPAANATIGFIRAVLSERYSKKTASSIPILYGGSVNPANIAEFLSQPEIDGALVGGASLNASHFLDIIRQADALKSPL